MNKMELKQVRSGKRLVKHWHRNLGMFILIVVSLLAITGIALNHSDDLHLNKKFVKWNWVFNLYGLKTPKNILTFSLDGNWVYKVGSTLYLNDFEIQHTGGQLVAATKLSNLYIIVLQNDILLINYDGELIDQLSDTTDYLQDIQAAGINQSKLVIKTANQIIESDDEFLEWELSKSQNIIWLSSQNAPAYVLAQIDRNFRGSGLSYERIILDLHGGRVFGKAAVYFWDLCAIGLLMMCLSGAWMWIKPKKNTRQKTINQQLLN